MKILLFGAGESYAMGSFFRNALEALDIEYAFIDESKYLKLIWSSKFHRLMFHLLKRPLTYQTLNSDFIRIAHDFQPGLILITKGAFISSHTLAVVKETTQAMLANYATDDPFNSVVSTRDLLAGISKYDLYVCTKRAIMTDVERAGCSRVEFVPFGYEPGQHYPEAPANSEERGRFSSDVVFIGGADMDRVPIFRDVAKMPNVRLILYGGYWGRALSLRRFYHGMAVDRDYRLALGGAKIAIGLVRRANRDGHSMRTFEIPACGTFMLAERTEEHLEFFEEDKEAAFFNSNEELVDKIAYYLTHDTERQRIAEAGRRRVEAGHHTYQDRLIQILRLVDAL